MTTFQKGLTGGVGLGVAFTVSALMLVPPTAHDTITMTTYSVVGRKAVWECRGAQPSEWACREIPRERWAQYGIVGGGKQ